jgi:hypothetical protein
LRPQRKLDKNITKEVTFDVGEDAGEKRTLKDCCWGCKLVPPLWKTVWRFLKILKIELPYDPMIPCLVIYPKESKSAYQYLHPHVYSNTVHNSQNMESA